MNTISNKKFMAINIPVVIRGSIEDGRLYPPIIDEVNYYFDNLISLENFKDYITKRLDSLIETITHLNYNTDNSIKKK